MSTERKLILNLFDRFILQNKFDRIQKEQFDEFLKTLPSELVPRFEIYCEKQTKTKRFEISKIFQQHISYEDVELALDTPNGQESFDEDNEWTFQNLNTNILNLSVLSIHEQERLGLLRMNDIVNIFNRKRGIIKYFDEDEQKFGVQLVEEDGDHNGTVNGTKYFECAMKKGIFVKSKDIVGRKEEFQVHLKAKITFSSSVFINISSFDLNESIKKCLQFYTKTIGVQSIEQITVSGEKKAYSINFSCVFWKISVVGEGSEEAVIKTAIADILETNKRFHAQIIEFFDCNEAIKINEFKIERKKNLISLEEMLEKRKVDAQDLREDLIDIRLTPLRLFTCDDLTLLISCWIKNDVEHIARSKKILEYIALKNKFSGIEIVRIKDHLKVLLEKHILPYMTMSTFDVIYNCLTVMIQKTWIYNQSASDIANMICDYPLEALCDYIEENDINGESIINNSIEFASVMEKCTGWSKDNIDQITALFMRHRTKPSQTIKDEFYAADKNEYGIMKTKIFENELSDIDLEELQLKLKRGMKINDESMSIMYAVEIYENPNQSISFTKDVYNMLAKSLKFEGDWNCSNCGNYNFACYIGGKPTKDLTKCRLCGIDQISSIIILLKQNDTYMLLKCKSKKDDKEESTDQTEDEKYDTSNELNINISCPNLATNKDCPFMINLSNKIAFYQKWIDKIKMEKGNNDITITTQIDITKVDDETFKKIILNSANNLPSKHQLNNKDIEKVQKILRENVININNFSSLPVSKLSKIAAKATNNSLKAMIWIRIFRIAKPIIKNLAYEIEFGKFFNETEANEVDDAYHHIIHIHIKNGNRMTKENVFRYFQTLIYCVQDDCSSLSRHEQRVHETNDFNDQNTENKTDWNAYAAEDKEIWTKQQYYIQSQLDMIHGYFVHHDWQNDINIIQKTDTSATQKKNVSRTLSTNVNKDKFISNITNENSINRYGFGIDHDYVHLSPVYCCLRDEIIKNDTLNIEIFENKLVKAIKKHKIAIDIYNLRCTHYDSEYCIIRNEPISVRHILVLCLYTDCSKFCTKYRETYRKLNSEETEQSVTDRNCTLYWFSRFLFESIEFFGEEMPLKMKVFHGLNKVMMFERFTAYYYQPLSTTQSFATAQHFSNEEGIILTFTRADSGENKDSIALIPRYMDVSWLSIFPNEDERLFYGKNIVFKIHDIMEANNLKHNRKQLKVLNTFQQLTKNQDINWSKSKNMINDMINLITIQKNRNKQKYKHHESEEFKQDLKEATFISKLFQFYCMSTSSEWVCIRNFDSMPFPLKNVLFNCNSNGHDISFIDFICVFPCCTKLVLNNLNGKIFTEKSKKYLSSVLGFIHMNNEIVKTRLNMIIFESDEQKNGKPNSTLNNLSNMFYDTFNKLKWTVSYQFKLERHHSLQFLKQIQ
eukprot:516448_1